MSQHPIDINRAALYYFVDWANTADSNAATQVCLTIAIVIANADYEPILKSPQEHWKSLCYIFPQAHLNIRELIPFHTHAADFPNDLSHLKQKAVPVPESTQKWAEDTIDFHRSITPHFL